MRLLLDVNVLVALMDESHIHHGVAQKLIAQPKVKIATCALTENALIRVLNLPGYSAYGRAGFEAVRTQLQQLCEDKNHEYWPCDITLRDESLVQ